MGGVEDVNIEQTKGATPHATVTCRPCLGFDLHPPPNMTKLLARTFISLSPTHIYTHTA
jgi:hypothetical protein